MFQKLKNLLLDTLFPVSCLLCQKSETWLCKSCFQKISLLQIQVCPYCEKIETIAGTICQKCKQKFIHKNSPVPIDKMLVATNYSKFGVSRLIHAFKYNFLTELSIPLSKLILSVVLDNHLPLPDFIVPVPLHPRRERWRGFNQAETLAKNLAENLSPGLPIRIASGILIRKKFTPPQMKIKGYAARLENMRDSFGFSEKYFINEKIFKNKKILLIDDIATTGSTLLECAKLLKVAGAKNVFAAVIARQEIK